MTFLIKFVAKLGQIYKWPLIRASKWMQRKLARVRAPMETTSRWRSRPRFICWKDKHVLGSYWHLAVHAKVTSRAVPDLSAAVGSMEMEFFGIHYPACGVGMVRYRRHVF